MSSMIAEPYSPVSIVHVAAWQMRFTGPDEVQPIFMRLKTKQIHRTQALQDPLPHLRGQKSPILGPWPGNMHKMGQGIFPSRTEFVPDQLRGQIEVIILQHNQCWL